MMMVLKKKQIVGLNYETFFDMAFSKKFFQVVKPVTSHTALACGKIGTEAGKGTRSLKFYLKSQLSVREKGGFRGSV